MGGESDWPRTFGTIYHPAVQAFDRAGEDVGGILAFRWSNGLLSRSWVESLTIESSMIT